MNAESIPELKEYRVLFVCLGNICRSPAAEGVARHLAAGCNNAPPSVWDSAGTAGWHQGSSPDSRMREAGRRRGIPISGAARQLVLDDFDRFDLIIPMDEDNLRDVLDLAPDDSLKSKVIPMVAFSRREPKPRRVPDPYHGGPEGFEEVLDILEDACGNLVSLLNQRQRRQ